MVKTPRKLGHLVVKVRDLGRSVDFYTGFLGLNVTGQITDSMVFMAAEPGSSHELAVVKVGDKVSGPQEEQGGLAHMAWQMDTMEDLRDVHRRLTISGQDFRIGDHGISLGIYFKDPDGNEVEAFYELPRNRWPKGSSVVGGTAFPFTF